MYNKTPLAKARGVFGVFAKLNYYKNKHTQYIEAKTNP